MASNIGNNKSQEIRVKRDPGVSLDASSSLPNDCKSSNSQSAHDPLALYLSQPTQLSNTNPISWRRSDPIYAILRKRQSLQKKFSVSSQSCNTSLSKNPRKGFFFPIEETLSQCQDKLPIIHRAFDAAAFSILRALQLQKENHAVHSDLPEKTADLPRFLSQLDAINKAKKHALDIVSNKRKGDNTGTAASTTRKQDKIQKKKENQKVDKKEAPTVQLAGYSNFDSRTTVSRAILCAAASLTFKQLTPKFDQLQDINVLDVPQNERKDEKSVINADNQEKDKDKDYKTEINMGAVTIAADIFAKRTVEQVRGVVIRGEKRRRWRSDCARSDLARKDKNMSLSSDGVLDQFFRWRNVNTVSDSDSSDVDADAVVDSHFSSDSDDSFKAPKQTTASEEWSAKCLPRLLKIMNSGAGNLVLHDMLWRTRANRVLELLKGLATSTSEVKLDSHESRHPIEPNYGPHLIMTNESDLDTFMHALGPLDFSLGAKSSSSGDTSFYMRGLRYHGNNENRRRMRIDHFTSVGLSGLSDTPYNVIVTTYKTFLQDYLHFCQIPFQSVVLDDGMSWLGTAHFDPNGQIGKVFDMAMWNKSDNHAGLAGVKDEKWNFALDVSPDGIIDTSTKSNDSIESASSSLTGLTARRRILVASSLHSRYREVTYSAPVPALLSFLLPQFTDVVREEWDRSRIHTCEKSMEHIRRLISRGIVVYNGSKTTEDLFSLAISSMTGTGVCKGGSESYHDVLIDKKLSISTDKMISDGKIVQSRRLAASWLQIGSPIRQELGTVSLEPIINAFKARSSFCICDEIVTTSSITANGPGGAVSGPSAFRPALRCGREFGSEQGTRQHLAALHAPPGTWLCRSCSVDCGTSQARTHHERSCASNITGTSVPAKENSLGGGVPSVGQNSKKKRSISNPKAMKDKDEAGNLQVSTYHGVWVNPKGKYFVKVNGEPIMKESDTLSAESTSGCLYFDCADEAAKVYDETKQQRNEITDLNFKSDGTRMINDEVTTSTATGRGLEMLGGGASSVVPALSVINIKDLPKGVVPLLRDPKQTSRAGGNAKRFIYAYRGVCRQARKGHDRWQSQISFGGTNHYLGTFDSEWDAAAIYAWAHLILYGEEATKKAQREGEDAVAAYEQEKKDIAEGKIVAPTPTKKKRPAPKSKGTGQRGRRKKTLEQSLTDGQTPPLNAEVIKASIPKMTPDFQRCRTTEHDSNLISGATERILASQSHDVVDGSRCVSIAGLKSTDIPPGHAAFIGLSSKSCQWSVDNFVDSMQQFPLGKRRDSLLTALASECSLNTRFRSLMQGNPCFIGKAPPVLEQASETLGFYGLEFGGTIGHVDCNIGGIEDSCSEHASCISYSEQSKAFRFRACGQDDIVTLNGVRIKSSMGSFTIGCGDICSVGARVFMFILPSI